MRMQAPRRVPDRQSAGNDRLLEVLGGPAFERIAPQGTDQRDRSQRAGLWLRRRRKIGRLKRKMIAVINDFQHRDDPRLLPE